MSKKRNNTQKVSYADATKVSQPEKPKNYGHRKGQKTLDTVDKPEQEPLIDLNSDHSSSDEAGNSKNRQATKKVRTSTSDAIDEDSVLPKAVITVLDLLLKSSKIRVIVNVGSLKHCIASRSILQSILSKALEISCRKIKIGLEAKVKQIFCSNIFDL